MRTAGRRQAPPTLDIDGLRRMQTARGLILCLTYQNIIATTDQMARSAQRMYAG